MKITSLSKPLIITIFTLALLSYGFVVVNAAYPLTEWEPGETLDPTCAPGDANCSVATGWQLDLTNGYVFNDTDFVGIGTDTPSVALDVLGDINHSSTLPSGGVGLFAAGDTTALGGAEGYTFVVVDTLPVPNAVGSIALNLINIDEPRIRLQASNTTYQNYLDLETTTGNIDIGAAGGGNININSDNNINLDGDNFVYLGSAGDVILDATTNLSITAENAWYGGVSDGTTDAGTYRSDFAQTPFDAIPAIVWELKNNQNYALGFAALDDVGNRKYSNIFYGSLDVNNNITDITRIEAADIGASTMFTYDTMNNYTNYSYVDAAGVRFITQDAFNTHTLQLESDGDVFASVLQGGATTLETDANGNIIRTPSDEKLKTDIETMTDNLDRVLALNPVEYNWKDTERFGEQRQMGFIAQELELVVPEVVRSGGEYKSVNYQILTALLSGAIQEISAKIDVLEEQTISAGGFSLASLRNTMKNFLGDVGNGIQDIFAKRVTTKELCIEDLCFDRQEAETLKQLISSGIITEDVQEEIIEEEVIVPEVVEQDEVTQEPEIVEQMQEEELEPENQEEIIVPSEPEEEIISEPEILPEPTI